jgi:hypothetical protein
MTRLAVIVTSTPISFFARGGSTTSVGVGVGVRVEVGAGVGVSTGVEVGASVGMAGGVTVDRTRAAVVGDGAIGAAGVAARLAQPDALRINKPPMMPVNIMRR